MPQTPLNLRVTLLLLLTVLHGCVGGTNDAGNPRTALPSTSVGDLRVVSALCEGRVDPLAVDAALPRLSWVLASAKRGARQSAYRVLVATSERILAEGRGDLWDSGKVASSEAVNVPYACGVRAGAALTSGLVCHWKVRVWDGGDTPSAWSTPAMWEVGLLSSSDWGGAAWLNDGKTNPPTSESMETHDPAPLFRKEFTIDKPVRRARLHIAGLGYYEATLNSGRIGDHMLDPGWTAYDRRVLYSTYDVTKDLKPGDNCLGVTVGNGWYNPLPLRMWGNLNLREHLPIGRPRFIATLSIEYADGTTTTVVSDPSWKTNEGPIRFNNIYLGEVYDARLEVPGWTSPRFDDASWRAAVVAPEPVGPLQPQSQPPIRITGRIPTVCVTEPKPGVFIYDLGENFSGWAAVSLRGPFPPGTAVTLRYGELLNKDGTLNPMTSVAGQIKGTHKNKQGVEESIGGPGAPPIAWQRDVYITRGTPDASGAEMYIPRFTFHAFRYVEITGLPEGTPADRVTIGGLRLNSDVADAGSFECSNELFNDIQRMCRRTFLANILSVQSDCPHRERFGYGGDIVATNEAYSLNFDMAGFYAKAARDFSDAARPGGLLTDTAPFVGIQYCGVGWAMAHPTLLTQMYREYGDERLMREEYEASRRWLLRVAQDFPDGLVTEGLNDHEGLASSPTPQMVTPLFVKSAGMLSAMARVLGKEQDAAAFEAIVEKSRSAYLKAYSPTSPTSIAAGTQASLAFALWSDLVPEADRPAVVRALVGDIREKHAGRLSTGIMGTKFMLDQLSREGRADVAYALVNRREFPGWGWMLENGATTLWEHWELSANTFSHSHPMFGSVSQWFYNWLGGIQPAPEAKGFDSIVIRPQPVAGLDWVRSSHRTVRGTIVSNWKREGERLVMEVEIPVGARALVYVPADGPEEIAESGRPLHAIGPQEIEVVRVEARGPAAAVGAAQGVVVCWIGSGSYRFVVKAPGGTQKAAR